MTPRRPADSATVYRPRRSSTNRFITFDPRCTVFDWPKRMPDSGHGFRNTMRSRAAIATARQSQPKRASHANRNAQAEKEPTLNHRAASVKTSMREPRNGGDDVAAALWMLVIERPSAAPVDRMVPRRAAG